MSRQEDLAWVAGFFDKGGTVSIVNYRSPSNGKVYPRGNIATTSYDRETLDHLQGILKAGSVTGPMKSEKGINRYQYNIYKKRDVLEFIVNVLPYIKTTHQRQRMNEVWRALTS